MDLYLYTVLTCVLTVYLYKFLFNMSRANLINCDFFERLLFLKLCGVCIITVYHLHIFMFLGSLKTKQNYNLSFSEFPKDPSRI